LQRARSPDGAQRNPVFRNPKIGDGGAVGFQILDGPARASDERARDIEPLSRNTAKKNPGQRPGEVLEGSYWLFVLLLSALAALAALLTATLLATLAWVLLLLAGLLPAALLSTTALLAALTGLLVLLATLAALLAALIRILRHSCSLSIFDFRAGVPAR
jgi:hypothetical protein